MKKIIYSSFLIYCLSCNKKINNYVVKKEVFFNEKIKNYDTSLLLKSDWIKFNLLNEIIKISNNSDLLLLETNSAWSGFSLYKIIDTVNNKYFEFYEPINSNRFRKIKSKFEIMELKNLFNKFSRIKEYVEKDKLSNSMDKSTLSFHYFHYFKDTILIKSYYVETFNE